MRPTGGQNLRALTNGSGYAACSREYGWLHVVAETTSAVCGAFFSGLSSRLARPLTTLRTTPEFAALQSDSEFQRIVQSLEQASPPRS